MVKDILAYPSRLRFPDLLADRAILTACLHEASKALDEGNEWARPFVARFNDAIDLVEADLQSRSESDWRRYELRAAGIGC